LGRYDRKRKPFLRSFTSGIGALAINPGPAKDRWLMAFFLPKIPLLKKPVKNKYCKNLKISLISFMSFNLSYMISYVKENKYETIS